ncbi:protein anachronism [Anopheles ziemanni]|uniref:protein anachronism n=1 Tax=Anopheles coustani TaxID=139045 RepID=UPI00265A4453|nr:protein anachronism [Anopheles coustani]XP_058167391.1 protein anachronism [Anopheles ziemanni]
MKMLIPVALWCLLLARPGTGAPFTLLDESIPVPESKMIDFENLTESEREQFMRENVNITALKIQQRVLREQQNKNRTSGQPPITQSTHEQNISDPVKKRKIFAEHITGNIKHIIESNLMRNDTVGQLATTHEMAFSAVCEIPKNTNFSQWNEDNTWNLYFRLPYNKQYNSVYSAVLRLYVNGINSTGTRNLQESDNCKNPADQMIRITTSVYYRKNRKDNTSIERKKRVCSCLTIPVSYRGWISMDTLLAVKMWDKPKSNFGIAIDVEDMDDRPLRAADFFQPTDCSEASRGNVTTLLPWSFFRNSLSWTPNEMDNVPHVPRIDIGIYKTMHHNHRPFLSKSQYGYNVRHHVPNGATAGSYSGNSYEHDVIDGMVHVSGSTSSSSSSSDISAINHHHHQHHHQHHKVQRHNQQQYQQHPVAMSKTHKKRRHLNYRVGESEENQSASASSSSSAGYDSSAATSGEDRKL